MLTVLGTTPTKAALWGIISVVIVSYFRRASAMTPSKIVSALINGAKGAVDVAIACAAAGIIIGVFTMTGLGLKLSNLVITLSQGNLLIALILTMVACIILGMGVPTAAAYIITAALVAPALSDLGVEPIAAHMFIFYFAIISAITPPVALAAFTGAGIANSNSMRTAFTASRLGIVAYIVPFSLVYGPSLVLVGTPTQIVLSTVTALIGVFLLGIGVQGWFLFKLNNWVRAFLVILSLTLIKPGLMTDTIGIIGAIVITLWIYKKKKNMGIRSEPLVNEKSMY
jgi:TRAP transporter 4TM/12TM fusion protein